MYQALPNFLTIKQSTIHGLGLFASKGIPQGTNLGVSHFKEESGEFENNYIRTPLGGFINHSDEPNCIKYQPFVLASPPIESGYEPAYYSIKTLCFIEKGEELTILYTLYKVAE